MRPFCVRAEHSQYLTAPISLPMLTPWAKVMGASFFSRSDWIVSALSRMSSLVPTRIMGVFGQWCDTSGYHYTNSSSGNVRVSKTARLKRNPQWSRTLERTFSYEAGEIMEKQMRKTSVCGYDRGRRRS